MLWEEFSSVLLLPPCGKFEDLYIRFNAVDCYWTQKQERSKKICLGCFLRVNWPGWIGSVCHVPAPPLVFTLSCCAVPALLQHLEIPQDNSKSCVLDGTGLLQSLCQKKTYPRPVLLPVAPGSALQVLAALLWKGQELPATAALQH